jgi:anthranilate synthase component 1
MYLLDFLDFHIVGSSPETMIPLHDGKMVLRPLAGTRKRGKNKDEDIILANELLKDSKEKAEHIMLVDLGRNDLGRVAKKGSIKVNKLMNVEKYSHVMHISSEIIAKIDDKYNMFDAFMATFSAGTMTGTPKIRAMELIAELEKVKRSFYSGAVGYFGFDGNMDNAIAIRTALIKKDKVFLQAGAGIVADSKNELEFMEIENKLKAMISTLEKLTI